MINESYDVSDLDINFLIWFFYKCWKKGILKEVRSPSSQMDSNSNLMTLTLYLTNIKIADDLRKQI